MSVVEVYREQWKDLDGWESASMVTEIYQHEEEEIEKEEDVIIDVILEDE